MGLIFRNTSIIINLKTRKEVTSVGKYKNFEQYPNYHELINHIRIP